MAQIIPIKDLKDTSTLSAKVNAAKEPIFITKNGYGDMVIMSMKVYENLCKKKEAPQNDEPSTASTFTGAII